MPDAFRGAMSDHALALPKNDLGGGDGQTVTGRDDPARCDESAAAERRIGRRGPLHDLDDRANLRWGEAKVAFLGGAVHQRLCCRFETATVDSVGGGKGGGAPSYQMEGEREPETAERGPGGIDGELVRRRHALGLEGRV